MADHKLSEDLVGRIKAALSARYQAGYERGYEDALDAFQAALTLENEQDAPAPEPAPSAAATTETPPVAADDAAPHLMPFLQRAYERLQAAPGVTRREAQREWGGSNSVLYQLQKLGLAENRGGKFYPAPRAGGNDF
jgi:hypothetical protein